MSQSTGSQASSSTGRMALAIGIVGLVLGASGLGYALYLGQSQIPSQLSSVSVNVKPSDKTIRVEWTTAFDAGQDRFEPQYITVAQGDTLTIILITNDTGDAHTFTIGLALRNLGTTAQFVLNNSWIGLQSGQYVTGPAHNANFTGKPNTSYSFYSIARDETGNTESPPVNPDAETTTPAQRDTVGPTLSMLWNHGVIATGPAYGAKGTRVLEWIGFFYGTGALITLLASYGLGFLAALPLTGEALPAGTAATVPATAGSAGTEGGEPATGERRRRRILPRRPLVRRP